MSEYGGRDFASDNDVRALIGSILMVGGLACFWYCAYKCIECRHEEEQREKRRVMVQQGVSCSV